MPKRRKIMKHDPNQPPEPSQKFKIVIDAEDDASTREVVRLGPSGFEFWQGGKYVRYAPSTEPPLNIGGNDEPT